VKKLPCLRWRLESSLPKLKVTVLFIVEESNRSVVVSVVEDSEGQAIRSNTELQSVTTTTTYTQRLNNQYFMLNIPVGIGMQSKLGKSRFSFSGGASYNLFTSFSGSIYNESRTLVNLVSGTSLDDNFLKNSTSWGLWTSFSFDRPISKNTFISLSIGLQAPLSKITKADFYYDQRLYITNLSMGFKYTLPTKSDRKSRNLKGKL